MKIKYAAALALFAAQLAYAGATPATPPAPATSAAATAAAAPAATQATAPAGRSRADVRAEAVAAAKNHKTALAEQLEQYQ